MTKLERKDTAMAYDLQQIAVGAFSCQWSDGYRMTYYPPVGTLDYWQGVGSGLDNHALEVLRT